MERVESYNSKTGDYETLQEYQQRMEESLEMKEETKKKMIELLDSIDDVQKLEYGPGQTLIFRLKFEPTQDQFDHAYSSIRAAVDETLGRSTPIILLTPSVELEKIVKAEDV